MVDPPRECESHIYWEWEKFQGVGKNMRGAVFLSEMQKFAPSSTFFNIVNMKFLFHFL